MFPVPFSSQHPGHWLIFGNKSRGSLYLNYLTGGCWELSAPLLVEPPLELSLFQDSEKRPLAVGRPGPDAPDATDKSSRVENARSLLNSLRSDHFFLDAIVVQIQSRYVERRAATVIWGGCSWITLVPQVASLLKSKVLVSTMCVTPLFRPCFHLQKHHKSPVLVPSLCRFFHRSSPAQIHSCNLFVFLVVIVLQGEQESERKGGKAESPPCSLLHVLLLWLSRWCFLSSQRRRERKIGKHGKAQRERDRSKGI